jgi:hypothetical protein
MVRSAATVYHNECRECEHKRDDCGPVYCYNCGDYYCSQSKHVCDKKRVKSHGAAMEASSKRGEEPRMNKPSYSRMIEDGFEMMNPYDKEDAED